METKFLPITDKVKIKVAMEKAGLKNLSTFVLDELNRLEAIIKNYEIGIKSSAQKLSDKTFKKPKPFSNEK